MVGVGARHAEGAQGQQQLAVLVIFAHHIARLAAARQAVGDPDMVRRIDIDAVGIDDLAWPKLFTSLPSGPNFRIGSSLGWVTQPSSGLSQRSKTQTLLPSRSMSLPETPPHLRPL